MFLPLMLTDVTTTEAVDTTTTVAESTNLNQLVSDGVEAVSEFFGISVSAGSALMASVATAVVVLLGVVIARRIKRKRRGYFRK